MSVRSLAYFRIALLGLCLISVFSGCKNKQPAKGNANNVNEANKLSCTNSRGTWQVTYCQCPSGMRQDPATQYRCIEEPKPNCNVNTQHVDPATNQCVDNSNPNDLTMSRTAKDCFDRAGWWNGTTCASTVPTTQDACQKFGDQWINNACARVDPLNKSTVCGAGGGAWNDSGCTCQAGSNFDWNYFRCVTGNPGGYGGPGQYPPNQACEFGNGQWNGSFCVCPAGTQFDQNIGRCTPDRGYTPYCPGQFDARGNCMAMGGQQMMYSLLYGWIMQALYLDDPNRPEEKEPAGDGH